MIADKHFPPSYCKQMSVNLDTLHAIATEDLNHSNPRRLGQLHVLGEIFQRQVLSFHQSVSYQLKIILTNINLPVKTKEGVAQRAISACKAASSSSSAVRL